MKDYCANLFERKTFILNYSINLDKKIIIVNYADGFIKEVPYSKREELSILKQMKNQVFNGQKTYEYNRNKCNEQLRKNSIYNAILGIYLALLFSIFHIGTLPFLIFSGISSFAVFKLFKKYKTNIKKIKDYASIIEDYEKNLNFVLNEKNFSNDKIITPKILNIPNRRIQYVIGCGFVKDSYDELVNNLCGVSLPYFDKKAINEDDPNSYLEEQKLLEEGYFNYSKSEVPYVNINSISSLTKNDLDIIKSITSKEKAKVKILGKVKKRKSNMQINF